MANPYVPIDAAYSDVIAAAVVVHEQQVASANAQLALDLAAADDSGERQAILEAFDIETAPIREAYRTTVAKAQATRESARDKAQADYDAYLTAIQADQDAKDIEDAALATKLKAGTATAAEVQKALANVVDAKTASDFGGGSIV